MLLTKHITEGNTNITVTVDYDPTANQVDKVIQLFLSERKFIAGKWVRKTAILPVDSVSGMLAKYIDWFEVYRQEMQSGESYIEYRIQERQEEIEEAKRSAMHVSVNELFHF